ncbi:hypothetical protein BaRGS_00013299 [Batillaria attramentaria]|uniref:Uncharacterized protein n=1 Tax=Batillaria attramentaria TaxID=370345 RepID=A0ABD0L7W8_9CAEN
MTRIGIGNIHVFIISWMIVALTDASGDSDDNTQVPPDVNGTAENQENAEQSRKPNTIVLGVTASLAMTVIIIAIIVVRSKSGKSRPVSEPAVHMRVAREESPVVVRQIQTTQPRALSGYYCTVECEPVSITRTRAERTQPTQEPDYSDTYESKCHDADRAECVGGSSVACASLGDEMYENSLSPYEGHLADSAVWIWRIDTKPPHETKVIFNITRKRNISQQQPQTRDNDGESTGRPATPPCLEVLGVSPPPTPEAQVLCRRPLVLPCVTGEDAPVCSPSAPEAADTGHGYLTPVPPRKATTGEDTGSVKSQSSSTVV